MAARAENNEECIAILDEVFESQPLAYWKEALADFKGVWVPFQTLNELYDDPQVVANGYLPSHDHRQRPRGAARGQSAMFNEQPVSVDRAPNTASTPKPSSSKPASPGTTSPP